MRSRLNRIGIVLSSSYLLVALGIKWITYHQFKEALQKQNIEYQEISTRPAPMNIIVWNANVDTKDSYLIGDYSIFDNAEITFDNYSKNRVASAEIAQKPNVQRLIKISQGWYLLHQKKSQWYFNDLRFGLLPSETKDPEFVFSYLLKEENGHIQATEVRKRPEDAKFLLTSPPL